MKKDENYNLNLDKVLIPRSSKSNLRISESCPQLE